MSTIKQCFKTILAGEKEQSRQAARQVRKLLYRSKGSEEFNIIKQQVNDAPSIYAGIKEDWRQENFVMAVSVIYYLHDREAEPDWLFPWLFELLEHERGAIRYAVVRMIGNELGPLTVHIRCPENKIGSWYVKPEKADAILLSMYLSLMRLLGEYYEPRYRKYKYISSLPSSPYKSMQMVLGRMDEDCGEGYLEKLAEKYQPANHHRPIVTKREIVETRDNLELEVAQLLEAANSHYTVEDVKKVIYEAKDEQVGFRQLMHMFDTGEGGVTVVDWMETVVDAWNYFPHRALNGKAPVEI